MEIRKAKLGDEQSIIDLIVSLAIYENEPDAVINTPEQLAKDLFVNKICEAFVAEEDGAIIGYALVYTSYSTWNGACLYLEDLFVNPNHRESGIGSQLFQTVIDLAKERKVKRLDWQVLNWNDLAIDFYEHRGATIDKDWYNGRLFFD